MSEEELEEQEENNSGFDDAVDNTKEQEENDNSFSSDNQSNQDTSPTDSIEEAPSKPSISSVLVQIVRFFKMLPPVVKITVLQILFYILIGVVIIIMIMLLAAAASGVSEELFQGLVGVGESVETFFDKAGNFFTGDGFVTHEEAAKKAEEKYFLKLQDVYKKYAKSPYNVQIDTTMITATLFYGRGMSDYIDDTSTATFEDGDEPNDEEVLKDLTSFYKVAKRHINTLAKYQIVENTAFNTCNTQPMQKIIPESDKEIADQWIGWWGWNTRATFNYQPYQTKSFVLMDGTAMDYQWCEYEDVEDLLADVYAADYKLYSPYRNKRQSCEITCEANNCIGADGLLIAGCTPCDVSVECADEIDADEEAYTKFSANWGTMINRDTGTFTNCVGLNNEPLTFLSNWGNDAKYKNYDFDENMIDSNSPPSALANFLQSTSQMFSSRNCSAKPSIITEYTVEVDREGVYYYKLLADFPTEWGFLVKKNFIESYYPSYVDTSTEESAERDAIKVVDGIFDMYDVVADRSDYCTYPSDYNYGGGNSYASADTQEFISMIADYVVQDMNSTGVLASVTIAQAILESSQGTSGLSSKYNNYYGETAGKSCTANIPTNIVGPVAPGTNGNTCQGNEYWDGTVVRMCSQYFQSDCQWYRVYSSFENSTSDHSNTFLRKNFAYCDPFLNNPEEYVKCLVAKENHKYAEDVNYVSSVMRKINDYNLTQYDELSTYTYAPSAPSVETNTVPMLTSTNTNCIPWSANGTGTIAGNGSITGIGAQGVRTALWGTPEYNTFWGSNNNLFYRSNKKLVKQCTWYAHGRGLEILTTNGMSQKTAQQYLDVMSGDAGTWFASNKYFSSSTNYLEPKIGAIVVWRNPGKEGHVAIIENINYDATGNITSVDLTEGGVSINGFRYNPNKSLEYIKAHGSYRFIGYVYLLD